MNLSQAQDMIADLQGQIIEKDLKLAAYQEDTEDLKYKNTKLTQSIYILTVQIHDMNIEKRDLKQSQKSQASNKNSFPEESYYNFGSKFQKFIKEEFTNLRVDIEIFKKKFSANRGRRSRHDSKTRTFSRYLKQIYVVTHSLIDLFANCCQEIFNIKGEISHLKSVLKNPTGVLANRQSSSAMVRNSSSQKLSIIKDRFFSKEGFESPGPVNNGSLDSGKNKASQSTFYQQKSKENYILRGSSKDTFSHKPDRPKYFTKKENFDQIIVDADESVRKSDRDDTFFNSRLDTEINTVKKTPRDEEADQ